MLKHEQTETETPAAAMYRPVPRRDEMTDAHIEDFLDHQCAPLIGKVSYEERVNVRSEMRQEIDSLVAAHEELGSTREQAIALALGSLATPVVAVTSQQTSSVRNTTSTGVATTGSLKPALWSFGAAAASSLTLVFANRHSSGDAMIPVMFLILAGFPFLAGLFLGSKNTVRPLSGMLLAQLLLYVPTTFVFWLLVNSETHNTAAVTVELAPFTAAYMAISTVIGAAGVPAGNWLKQTASRWKRKGRQARD